MALHDELETVLTAATHFSTSPTAAMLERQEALKRIASVVDSWLPGAVAASPLANLSLKVQAGGRQGQFAPVPWVRIFSPVYSPHATEGFYLVYLFAADGSAVYLSLNQGTSEFRSGKMRPIRETGLIRAMAAEATDLLEGWMQPVARNGLLTIDLAIEAAPVGRESKDRAYNYEAGNVIAVAYRSGALPDDSILRADLTDMLQLLGRVYEGPPGQGTVLVPAPRAGGQRRVSDGQLRKAIENRAMDVVRQYYESNDEWAECQDVSAFKPYDFLCRRKEGGGEVHVEVKGTTTVGSHVILTRNEVSHVREFSHTILAVISGIEVEATDEGLVATGGTLRIFDPWILDESALTATEYVYSIPEG